MKKGAGKWAYLYPSFLIKGVHGKQKENQLNKLIEGFFWNILEAF
jgi:hypothetical protein